MSFAVSFCLILKLTDATFQKIMLFSSRIAEASAVKLVPRYGKRLFSVLGCKLRFVLIKHFAAFYKKVILSRQKGTHTNLIKSI